MNRSVRSQAQNRTILSRILVPLEVVAYLICLGPSVGFFFVSDVYLTPGWAWVLERRESFRWLLLPIFAIAFILLVRRLRKLWRWSPAASVGVAFLALIPFADGLLITVLYTFPFGAGEDRVVHLEDPGVHARAAITCRGRDQLRGHLWVVRRGGTEWDRTSEVPQYPNCVWPFEVRKAAGRPRYLLVDSEGRASALLDLTGRGAQEWRVLDDLPPVESMRDEFGAGISGAAE